MKIYPLLFALLFASTGICQIKIQGTITEAESGEPLIGANVILKQDGRVIAGTVTDIDGSYTLNAPETGTFEIEVSYTGYTTQKFSSFEISEGKEKRLDVKLSSAGVHLDEVAVSGGAFHRSRKRKKEAAMKVADMGRMTTAPATMGIGALDGVMPRAEMAARGGKSAPAIPGISAGTLTAGEVHDFSKWGLWQDIADIDLERWRKHWEFEPTERYTVQAMTEAGQPVADAEVKLFSEEYLVWTARTDNTGRAELWANTFAGREKMENLRAEVTYNGQTRQLDQLSIFQQGINTVKFETACEQPDEVDILFVVDATGSMSDEIEFLKAELTDVIGKAQDGLPDLQLNLGSVFYRDIGDAYLTRKSDFSSKISKTTEFIELQSAGGGGDGPEAVEEALDVAIRQMSWSVDARARLLFLVLDAPPHHTPEIISKLQMLSQEAAAQGIRIIPLTGSGIDKGTEYLMRSLALTTNGTYTFLTDHSGVGGPHIEPTADVYDVEKLNDLLSRLILQFSEMPSCDEPIAEREPQNPQHPANEELVKKLGLRAFPNPSSGPLTIELKQPVDELFVTDLTGKILIRYADLPEGKTPVDLSNLPNGSYLLRVEVEETVVTERVVVLH